uniref:Uncharacterized protein n=1 Tax=uncultured marine virus TaxID=186617 RepID=A0A0F7L6L7_9VIRU|nr:hypothetical protein [uncultured marine virus]
MGLLAVSLVLARLLLTVNALAFLDGCVRHLLVELDEAVRLGLLNGEDGGRGRGRLHRGFAVLGDDGVHGRDLLVVPSDELVPVRHGVNFGRPLCLDGRGQVTLCLSGKPRPKRNVSGRVLRVGVRVGLVLEGSGVRVDGETPLGILFLQARQVLLKARLDGLGLGQLGLSGRVGFGAQLAGPQCRVQLLDSVLVLTDRTTSRTNLRVQFVRQLAAEVTGQHIGLLNLPV